MKMNIIKKILVIFVAGILCSEENLHALPCPKPIFKQVQASKNGVKAPTAKEIQSMESRLITLINLERSKKGVKALSIWNPLSQIAKEHTQNMANGSVAFGHGGFQERSDNIRKQGQVLAFGENVAYSYLVEDPVKTAVEMWMESPGHKKNILGDYAETGVAIVCNQKGYFYFTQLFAKR